MTVKYELFNDLRDPGDWIKIDLYESGLSLGLSRFWCNMISEERYESIKNDEDEQFKVTMDYLTPLLVDGKIKMKTYEYYEQSDPEGYEGKIFKFHNGRVWKQGEVNEGIRQVGDRWFSIKNKRERESFKDGGVMFTLQDNEWMM